MREYIMKKRIRFLILLLAIFIVGCNSNEIDVFQNESDATQMPPNYEENENIKLPEEALQKGDENEQVAVLQQALIKLGYPIEETGKYDNMTTWAITDIQLQQEELLVSGMYSKDVKQTIEQALQDEINIEVEGELTKPTHSNQRTEIVENPYEILVLVNKNFSLPNDFKPHDLVVPEVNFPFEEDDPKKQLRKEAALALEDLFNDAKTDGIDLFAQSGYRSYDRQETIFAAYVERHGEEHANTYSARAGESEHQTGLVMDVTAQSVEFDLITEFGDTKEGTWIENHAHEHGFIIRYPEGKEHITQYQYEPWHLRYVGEKAATEIARNDLTLEEYLGVE